MIPMRTGWPAGWGLIAADMLVLWPSCSFAKLPLEPPQDRPHQKRSWVCPESHEPKDSRLFSQEEGPAGTLPVAVFRCVFTRRPRRGWQTDTEPSISAGLDIYTALTIFSSTGGNNSSSGMIIGIDLGTTNSVAAYLTADGPQLI